MVQFDLFSSQAEQNYITLSAEQLVMFDSADEEIYPIGTPQIWDDYIIQKIPLEDFDVFHIYAHIIPKSLCSRITDYKKIWGLREIPRGIADNSCEIGSQKIYWGISRSHGRVGFESRYSSMLVLVPGNIECQPYCILDAFVKRGTDFISQNIMPIFSEICKDIPGAMILRYQMGTHTKLTIYSNNIHRIFPEEILFQNQKETALACRQPFCNLFS